MQQDKEELIRTLEIQEKASQQIKDILIDELTKISEHLEKSCKECFALAQTVQGCGRIIETKQEEKRKLNSVVSMLRKTRPEYVPDINDSLDTQLAKYLNKRSDWKTVSFYKVSDGVYMLGTKEVGIFQDEGKFYGRVGEGVMELDEFFSMYIPLEVNKMYMRDPVSIRRELVGSYMSSK